MADVNEADQTIFFEVKSLRVITHHRDFISRGESLIWRFALTHSEVEVEGLVDVREATVADVTADIVDVTKEGLCGKVRYSVAHFALKDYAVYTSDGQNHDLRTIEGAREAVRLALALPGVLFDAPVDASVVAK